MATVYGAEIREVKLGPGQSLAIVFTGKDARDRLFDFIYDREDCRNRISEPPITWPGTSDEKGTMVWSYHQQPIVIESIDCKHPICQSFGHCQGASNG